MTMLDADAREAERIGEPEAVDKGRAVCIGTLVGEHLVSIP